MKRILFSFLLQGCVMMPIFAQTTESSLIRAEEMQGAGGVVRVVKVEADTAFWLEAIPNPGFTFQKWVKKTLTGDVVDAFDQAVIPEPIVFNKTVDEESASVQWSALFTKQEKDGPTISVYSSTAGTIEYTRDDDYNYTLSVKNNVTANEGTVVNKIWDDGITDLVRTISLDASFMRDTLLQFSFLVRKSCDVEVLMDTSTAGSFDIQVSDDTIYSIKAISADDNLYSFQNWIDDGASAPIQVNVASLQEDTTFVAFFNHEKICADFVFYSSTAGAIEIDHLDKSNNIFTFSATNADASLHTSLHWLDNNSTELTRTEFFLKDTVFKFLYVDSLMCDVEAKVYDSNGGSVLLTREIDPNTGEQLKTWKLSADTAVGYAFAGWLDNGADNDQYDRTGITLNEDTMFTVRYNLPKGCPAEAFVYSSTAGTIVLNDVNTVTQTYSVDIDKFDDIYSLGSWDDDATQSANRTFPPFDTDTTFIFSLTEFSECKGTYDYEIYPSNGGTVSISHLVPIGKQSANSSNVFDLTVQAYPDNRFTGWDDTKSLDINRSITLNGSDTSFLFNFVFADTTCMNYEIIYPDETAADLSAQSWRDSVFVTRSGSDYTLVAQPGFGRTFKQWDDDRIVPTRPLDFDKMTYEAVFDFDERDTLYVNKNTEEWGSRLLNYNNYCVAYKKIVVVEDSTWVVDCDTILPVRGVLTYPGAKTIIEEGQSLQTDVLKFYANGLENSYPELVLNGTIEGVTSKNKVNNTLYYEVDTMSYYSLAMPGDMSMSDIISEAKDYQIYRYDGEQRANKSDITRTYSGWVLMENTEKFEQGHGYVVVGTPLAGRNTALLTFPFTMDLSKGESDFSLQVKKNQGLPETPDNDKGWNLLGNPYLATYKEDEKGIYAAYLDSTRDENGKWLGTYHWVDSKIRYITYTDDGYKTYQQMEANEYKAKPFGGIYFIQTDTVGADNNYVDLLYQVDQRAKRVKGRKSQISREVVGTIHLTNGSITDKTTLLFNDAYTEAYDFNADLNKFLGGGEKVSLYSLDKNKKGYAFRALSTDLVYKGRTIPLGYKSLVGDTLTFSLQENLKDNFKYIYLDDKLLGTSTDLLNKGYTFKSSDYGNDERFVLRFALNKPTDFLPEDIEKTNMPIVIYDVTGRLVSTNASKEKLLDLPRGAYLIVTEEGVQRYIVP